MSLKTFHLVFIIICIVLSLGFAAWNLANYFSPAGVTADLIVGAASALAAVGLVVYEAFFLKKTKNVSYLWTRPSKMKMLVMLGVAGLVLRTDAAHACAACFGRADGPLADGMNWGIMTLLAFVVVVLGTFGAFFIYLARRSAAVAATLPVAHPTVLLTTQKA